jgi:hypothetical protein
MKTLRSLLLVAVLFALALSAALPAKAHEGRNVGKYVVELGWRNEPATAGLPNGPDVYITFVDPKKDGGDNIKATLEALKVELSVEISFGPAKKTLKLRPNEPFYSEYEGVGYINFVADLIPTRAGDYTFKLTGTINDQAVDETYTSADKKFSSIEPASDLLFPDSAADFASLQDQIKSLQEAVEALKNAKK